MKVWWLHVQRIRASECYAAEQFINDLLQAELSSFVDFHVVIEPGQYPFGKSHI